MKIKIEHTPKISYKVAKMGGIPCLGLPVLTCRDDAPCKTSGKCYAMQGKYRTQSVKKGLMNNLLAYRENPSYFFEKLAIDIMPSRYFRWFHSGDIVDDAFFEGMVKVARKCKGTKFLAYTKKFSIVNRYLDNGGKIPKNLKIVFSGWGAQFKVLNPYGLPVTHVRLKNGDNSQIPEDALPCSGHCSNCFACWKLTNGESVVFDEHH